MLYNVNMNIIMNIINIKQKQQKYNNFLFILYNFNNMEFRIPLIKVQRQLKIQNKNKEL